MGGGTQDPAPRGARQGLAPRGEGRALHPGGDGLIKGYKVMTVPQPQPLVTGQRQGPDNRGGIATPSRAAAGPENEARLSAAWS